jgi:PKD repeat protein
VANFTPDGTKAPLGVIFSSAGSVDNDGTIATYKWDFGDGSAISNLSNPSHLYTTAGTYSATLTVTDNEGATDVKTVSVAVGPPNVAPVAAASGTPTSGRAPLTVAFSSAGSNDSDGTIATYSWNFGDGSPVDNNPSPSHTYAPGTWTATLTVTDNNGASASRAVTIQSTVNKVPTAVATGTPSSGLAPLAVAFNSAASTDLDGTIVSRVWDFGDGSATDTSTNPSHTYAPGNYVATLTITDNEGATATATVPIHANAAPVAVATADLTSGNAPLAVHFTGSGSSDDGSIASYSWNFGDGSPTSSSADPTHTYAPGVWTATLTVTDNEGVARTATVTVDVNDPPTASVTSNVTSGAAPLTVAFTGDAADSDGTFSFRWDFHDGSPPETADLTPSHTFTNPGTYGVTLTVTDDRGAVTVSAARTITVT